MTRRSTERLLLSLTKSFTALVRTNYNCSNSSSSLVPLSKLFPRFFSLFQSLAIKTLTSSILFMEDEDLLNNSSSGNSIIYLDAPSVSSSSSFNYGFHNNHRSFDDEGENGIEKLYLVSYRWWKEVESGGCKSGVLYNVASSEDDAQEEIVLDLRKEDGSAKVGDGVFVGREYALISGTMWLRALKQHNDSEEAAQDLHYAFATEGYLPDIFHIKIRLSLPWETNSLVVKISCKDNAVANYRKACNIFIPESKLLHIWDLSGQITQLLRNDEMSPTNSSPGQSNEEIPLELQVYGLSDSVNGGEEDIDEMAEHNVRTTSYAIHSVKMNVNGDIMSTDSVPSRSGSGYRGVGCLGLRGLQNLGNTCFMNSAIQCLGHTPKLVDYFLGDYRKDINYENQLGMKGELALAFGDLLTKLWTPGATAVAPRMFKRTLADYALQFSGYNQHDAQEFLAFLLDGLHEDLNRVKFKPYVEVKDADGRPHEELAEEYWQNHLARNNSIVVDLCQGQYRSTLVCPACKKLSVTFDPFMYLSLPLPFTTMRLMTLTVLSSFGDTLPCPITVPVPKCGRLKDLIEALANACALKNDETLLVAEIYKNKIFRFLEESSGSLALIRDDDKLVAYRLPKDYEAFPLVVFVHEQTEKPCKFERTIPDKKLFGIPLIGSLGFHSNGFEVYKLYTNLLNPFLLLADDALHDYSDVEIIANEDSVMEDALSPRISERDDVSGGKTEDGHHSVPNFRFHLEDDYLSEEMDMNEPLLIPSSASKLNVRVSWPNEMTEKYDTCLLTSLPEVFNPQLHTRRSEESVSLYRCLEAFLKEEPLGPDDMWYCPNCKKHRQAIKKLDLWRLPEVLVIHLKRFSYSRFIKHKLETYVDFPIDDLDLSTYISNKESLVFNRYVLYAISNHYGGMGGGHYTAFVDPGHRKWYEFDDDRVFPVSEDNVKSSAAYLLFYRRVT